jgi:taurine transport system permease protein
LSKRLKEQTLKSITSHFSIETAITIATFVVIIAAWYIITKFKLISDIFVPSPGKVIHSFIDTSINGYKGSLLVKHLADSMFRLLAAYLIAAATGIPLGLASGYNSKIRAIFDPLVEFYRPLPPLAYYTVLIIWLGIGDVSKITLLYFAALAPIYIACMSGVKSIRQDYIQGAFTLGASKGQVFRHVIFPACLPYIFTGLRTSMGAAYSTLVAAEMVAALTGIGWMVLDASRFLRSDIIYMGIIVMGVTGIILDQLIRLLERKVIPWKGQE